MPGQVRTARLIAQAALGSVLIIELGAAARAIIATQDLKYGFIYLIFASSLEIFLFIIVSILSIFGMKMSWILSLSCLIICFFGSIAVSVYLLLYPWLAAFVALVPELMTDTKGINSDIRYFLILQTAACIALVVLVISGRRLEMSSEETG